VGSAMLSKFEQQLETLFLVCVRVPLVLTVFGCLIGISLITLQWLHIDYAVVLKLSKGGEYKL
jgi:hypothetical protein